MTKRTVIDTSEVWGMRVSTPGKDVESDGAPYLFDGALETLQVHQTGVIYDIFQWRDFGTSRVHRCISYASPSATPSIEVTFPDLGYIPHIEWAVTSDAMGSGINFPSNQINYVGGSISSDILSLPATMIPSSDRFKIIATTSGSISKGMNHGGVSRQGDLYYTVFKRVTT